MKTKKFRLLLPLLLFALVLGFSSPPPAQAGQSSSDYGWIQWATNADPDHHVLFDISMVNAQDGWAVGEHGTILHWDGETWSLFNSPTTETLHAVKMLNSADGWAVGDNGTALQWTGTFWKPWNSGTTTATLMDVDMFYDNQGVYGVTVGENGAKPIIIRFRGQDWFVWESPPEHPVLSVALIDRDWGWIVGRSGAILGRGLGDWVNQSTPTQQDLYSVVNVSYSEGWAVGNGGTILRRAANAWNEFPSPTQNALLSVFFLPNGQEGWSVGVQGSILHYLNGAWTMDASPTQETLHSVTMLSPTSGWAVGDQGTILYYGANLTEHVYLPLMTGPSGN